MHQAPIIISGHHIAPGEQHTIEIPISYLYTQHDMTLPVRVIRGKKPGPVLFVSAALHGDEINGVEIISRLLQSKAIKNLRGTLLAIPVVNVFGFLHNSRYLPDRRDLNRSFPGSESGSMAARLAHTFLEEIVSQCTHGIDLHTAAIHRSNLPQIRVDFEQAGIEEMARAFGVPVVVDAPTISGSMRHEVQKRGVPLLLYECGEALRFDETSIRAGVRGVISVMRHIGSLPPRKSKDRPHSTVVAHSSHWIRAAVGGILRTRVKLGQKVSPGQLLGYIGNPFGENRMEIVAKSEGIVIGMNHLPLVDEGNALFHIALFGKDSGVHQAIKCFHEDMQPDDLLVGNLEYAQAEALKPEMS